MSTLTSMGYKMPETNERGYFTALEDNITRVNSHKHDGTDGEKIAPKDFNRSTSDLLAASWAAVAGQTGTYRQLMTLPSGYTMTNAEMKFIVNGGGEDGALVYPTVEKVSSTTCYVYINDNTIALKCIYG